MKRDFGVGGNEKGPGMLPKQLKVSNESCGSAAEHERQAAETAEQRQARLERVRAAQQEIGS